LHSSLNRVQQDKKENCQSIEKSLDVSIRWNPSPLIQLNSITIIKEKENIDENHCFINCFKNGISTVDGHFLLQKKRK